MGLYILFQMKYLQIILALIRFPQEIGKNKPGVRHDHYSVGQQSSWMWQVQNSSSKRVK